MTKLGPHILNPTDAAKHWAANAPIVKQAFGIEALRIARLRAPTICRPIWMLNKSGEQAAREILTRYLDWKFIPTYTELWNEYDEWGRDELRERLRQCKIAGDILRQHGCKVGDNIASTGTLEEREWRIAAEGNFGGMDFLPVHEYWGNQGFTTWHTLRYRRMHNILNGKHPPIIITETGRDKVEGGNGGWKTDGVSQEQYIAEIKAYDAEIQKDNYVLGATPFTSGPGDNWANFDMDGLEQYLIEKEKPMPVEYRDRWPAEYSQWKAGGGVSDADFLAWMAATKGLQLTAQEYDLIANATKGNIEALKQLAQRPKA